MTELFCENLLYGASDVCFYHVTYTFQNGDTFNTCLNVKELLARSRGEIWSLIDCIWTQTCNHLVDKRTLNHFAKLSKWLSFVVSTYLYGAFHSMSLSCQLRVSEWIQSQYLPEYQGTPCSEKARNLTLKWLQLVHLTICSYKVMCAFQIESTLYTCLNVEELEACAKSAV